MQIREQGKQVQLIRSTYNKELKRSEQKVVVHFARSYIYPSSADGILSAEQLAVLSDEERGELSAWLSERAEKAAKEDLQRALTYGSHTIQRCISALESGMTLEPEKAEILFAATVELQKRMKKLGLVPPRNSNAERQARHRQKLAQEQNLGLPI